ncbi:MAG: pyruvate ferredoxin oxidoreductase [Candidatus Moraniibacteriota bacterium]
MPEYISNNQNYFALTGAEAAAEAMRQIEPGVVPVYPITPQTPIIEEFANYVAAGNVKTEIITTESEHSAMSAAIGAAAAGSRTMTATSSVGLALMYEMLNIASGMRLPIVMNVANRALSSPINIHCDHSDTMGVRDSGWIQVYCETAQEVYDYNILAVRLAEHSDILLPTMVMQDGFVTSHLLERMEIIPNDDVKKFVGDYKYPNSLLGDKTGLTFGALMLPEYFFEAKVAQHQAFEKSKQVYKEIASELEKITGRNYAEIELYGVDEKTEGVIITMSSAAGTAKEVARRINKKGGKVGVVKIRLFRPFPYAELGAVIKNITNIAVLDRTFSFGSFPPLYSEVIQTLNIMNGSRLPVSEHGAGSGRDDNKLVQSYVFGLGGRDLREKDIKEVYADILGNKFTPEIKFLNLKH